MIDQNPTMEHRINPVNGLFGLLNNRYVNVFELTADDIQIEDIAHALARLCRYNGQVAGFLTVAGHSIRCAERAIDCDREDVALECLLHDAAEAYIGDLVRPLKIHPDFKESYRRLEVGIEAVIAEKLGLVFPFDPFVKEMDDAELQNELEFDRWNPTRWDNPLETKLAFIRFYEELQAARS